ncbi:hypothetical protein [Metapseudomonas otitidis]|uniref:hypothetical protein n=1 Tax=Metapseudomonas otitidis TaxID=319939 RepID=UPI0026146D93|nr:hypothetical protein [Pseudomonas otitidis]
MDLALRLIIAALFLALALYLLLRPTQAGAALARFYGRYPLVRLAPTEQLASRPALLRLLGLGLAVLGAAALLL